MISWFSTSTWFHDKDNCGVRELGEARTWSCDCLYKNPSCPICSFLFPASLQPHPYSWGPGSHSTGKGSSKHKSHSSPAVLPKQPCAQILSLSILPQLPSSSFSSSGLSLTPAPPPLPTGKLHCILGTLSSGIPRVFPAFAPR